jgi:hypothetical protein
MKVLTETGSVVQGGTDRPKAPFAQARHHHRPMGATIRIETLQDRVTEESPADQQTIDLPISMLAIQARMAAVAAARARRDGHARYAGPRTPLWVCLGPSGGAPAKDTRRTYLWPADSQAMRIRPTAAAHRPCGPPDPKECLDQRADALPSTRTVQTLMRRRRTMGKMGARRQSRRSQGVKRSNVATGPRRPVGAAADRSRAVCRTQADELQEVLARVQEQSAPETAPASRDHKELLTMVASATGKCCGAGQWSSPCIKPST